MTRERRPESVAARLLDFLERNPDENLSLLDVAAKFDVVPDHAATVVRGLEHEGLVVVERIVRKPRS